jgi:hypothetical protein
MFKHTAAPVVTWLCAVFLVSQVSMCSAPTLYARASSSKHTASLICFFFIPTARWLMGSTSTRRLVHLPLAQAAEHERCRSRPTSYFLEAHCMHPCAATHQAAWLPALRPTLHMHACSR